ncbi:polyprotein, partial [Bienertia sinuspersici]
EKSMATKVANTEEGSSQIKKNLYDWKYPKIPIDQVYKKKVLRISPSYAVKDFEDTITVNSNDKSVSGAPIVVSLRDARHLNFHDSLLALVKANLSEGPFYFDCFPSFSVSLDDASLLEVLTLDVKTGGVPLALTYRVVCKAMVDLRPEALKEPVLVHESTTSEQEPKPDDRVLGKGSSFSTKFANEKEGSSRNTTSLGDWKYPKIPVKQVYNSSDHNMLMGFRAISECPGHSIPLEDDSIFEMDVMSKVPLVLTYPVVCNVTRYITLDYRKSIISGETTYYQSVAGTERTTIWDD